jgi:hypothetical protein
LKVVSFNIFRQLSQKGLMRIEFGFNWLKWFHKKEIYQKDDISRFLS